jgi:glycine/D-amino acid oxidase-like deaminating enzyme
MGTTASSIAMLSSFPQMAWQEERGRAAMRPKIHNLFRELSEEVPGDYLHWSGSLLWVSEEEEQEFTGLASIAAQRGVDLEVIDMAAARELEPSVVFAERGPVFWERDSGWVDGPAIVNALVERFTALGGTLLTGTRIIALEKEGDKLKAALTDGGDRLEADVFVNAAGSWASHLSALAGVAIPLDLVPGTVVYTQPFEPGEAPERIINTPLWCGRPDPSGGLAIHWRGHSQTARHGENIDDGRDLMEEVGKVIPSLRGTEPVRSTIGIRPLPHGGPIIGALPWLDNFYHTVSHGGIGWGPMWGWLAAREILRGESAEELSNMRPVRFYLNPSQVGRHADDAEQQ